MLCPQLLHAQETPLLPEEKPQIETRHTAVLERVQPGYVAPGIPLGGFRLAPSVEVTGIHDDNIFGTQDDRVADSLLRIQPQLALASRKQTKAANSRVRVSRSVTLLPAMTARMPRRDGAGGFCAPP